MPWVSKKKLAKGMGSVGRPNGESTKGRGGGGKTPFPKHATNSLVGRNPWDGARDTTRRTWEQHG